MAENHTGGGGKIEKMVQRGVELCEELSMRFAKTLRRTVHPIGLLRLSLEPSQADAKLAGPWEFLVMSALLYACGNQVISYRRSGPTVQGFDLRTLLSHLLDPTTAVRQMLPLAAFIYLASKVLGAGAPQTERRSLALHCYVVSNLLNIGLAVNAMLLLGEQWRTSATALACVAVSYGASLFGIGLWRLRDRGPNTLTYLVEAPALSIAAFSVIVIDLALVRLVGV